MMEKDRRTAGADEKTPSRAQYFSWINHTNEGSNASQTLANLEYFGWMKDQIFPQSSLGRLVFFVIAWKSTIIILKFFIFCCRFYDSSVGKESSCNAGDPTLISGLGRSPGERKGYPLQYSGLENSMNCIVHRIAKSWT